MQKTPFHNRSTNSLLTMSSGGNICRAYVVRSGNRKEYFHQSTYLNTYAISKNHVSAKLILYSFLNSFAENISVKQ
jgi:hypothetical protein